MTAPKIEDFFEVLGNRKHFNASKAVAFLLEEDVLFINSRPYVEAPWQPKEEWTISENYTIVVFVLCNDVFAWGCADAEELDYSERNEEKNELKELLEFHLNCDKGWGSVKWVCKKRNEQPQAPMITAMKEVGAWNDMMEALPLNKYDNS